MYENNTYVQAIKVMFGNVQNEINKNNNKLLGFVMHNIYVYEFISNVYYKTQVCDVK